MSIAFLNPSGQLGGAERALLDVLASLRRAEPGWRLHLIVTADGPLVGEAESLGVGVMVVPLPERIARMGDGGVEAGGPTGRARRITELLKAAASAVGYRRQLARVLGEIDPLVVHSNGFKMHVFGVWARPRRARTVWHVHDFVRRRAVMSRLLRLHSRRCATAITNSQSVADDLRAVCGDGLRIVPVYNGVDLDRFRPTGPTVDLDTLAGLPAAEAGVVRVGLVATLGWWKGHEVFLRAVAELPARLPVRAYVIGGALYETAGSQRSVTELRALTADLGIEDRVGFTGFMEDAAAAMRSLDIVVHASTEPEPFGLVIAEGMATGRAVVASLAGGAAELIHPPVDALGHTPGSVQELADCLTTLVQDPALRTRIGAAARTTAEARFDRRRLAEELAPIYRSVVNGAVL